MISLVALHNNGIIAAGQPEGIRVGTRLKRPPPRIRDVLTGRAPATGKALAHTRAVVAFTPPGALHVAFVARPPLLGVACQ